MGDTYQLLVSISVIIQIILFIAFIVLIFTLSGYIKKLIGKTEEIGKDFNAFKVRIEPLIDDTQELVKKLNNITLKVEENIDTVKTVTEKAKSLMDDVIEFKDKIQKKVEPPIFDTINFYASVVKGIKVFAEKLKSSKPVKEKIPSENYLFDDKINYDLEIKEEYDDINKELNEVRKKLEEMKKV